MYIYIYISKRYLYIYALHTNCIAFFFLRNMESIFGARDEKRAFASLRREYTFILYMFQIHIYYSIVLQKPDIDQARVN